FHVVARSKKKLLLSLIVLVDNTTIRSGEPNGGGNNRGEYRLKIQTQNDGFSDLSQGLYFTDPSPQLTGSDFQFFGEPDRLNLHHPLVGKAFDEVYPV